MTAGRDLSEERTLIRHALDALGSSADLGTARRLTNGRSGSLVVALDQDAARLVLKVTRDADRLPRAALEVRLVADPQLQRDAFVPRFVAGAQRTDSVWLLTERYSRLPDARAIDPSTWARLAARLGALHRSPVPTWSGLEPRAWPSDQQVAAACLLWADFAAGGLARRAAAVLTGLGHGPPDLDLVLTHGDCHIENLLRDDHRTLRWIDWQEACLSDGAEDLVFLWQRAEFSGADPPREAMLRDYCAARAIDCDVFRRAVFRAELRLLLVSWPYFLGYGPPARRRRMIERLAALV